MLLIPPLRKKILILDQSNQVDFIINDQWSVNFLHSAVVKIGYSEKLVKWFKMKILLCKGGMRKIFPLLKFSYCLVKLDFTLWTKSTVVEFSKGQIDRIFLRSVLRPLQVYLSFGILHIPVSIHEGITPRLPNRGHSVNEVKS